MAGEGSALGGQMRWPVSKGTWNGRGCLPESSSSAQGALNPRLALCQAWRSPGRQRRASGTTHGSSPCIARWPGGEGTAPQEWVEGRGKPPASLLDPISCPPAPPGSAADATTASRGPHAEGLQPLPLRLPPLSFHKAATWPL